MENIKYLCLFVFAAMLCVSCTVKTAEQTTTAQITEQVADRSSSQVAPMQIFLVRHAEKSKDDPRDPSLNKYGQERAQKLLYLLQEARITKIYTTDYKRTQQTIAPLADALNIQPEIYATDLVSITKDLKSATQGNILVVGHSNTTPKLVNNLMGTMVYEKLDELIYNKLYVVTKNGDQCSATVLQY